MASVNRFCALYKVSMALIVGEDILNIPTSDVVSIMLSYNYDTMTYPMIRFRLYSDIDVIQRIMDEPNNIYIRTNMDGGIYKISDENSDDKSPILVSPIKGISFQMKAYIEKKNIPTSTMNQYVDGIKKNNDLNTNVKEPIE